MNDFSFPYHFIAVEGNIGTGKTTFCKKISEQSQCELILEQFSDNPFLPLFYENPERYAFAVELFFMTERHRQLQEFNAQQSLFSSFTFADYFFAKSLLFARMNLKSDEYRLFQRLFNILLASSPKPDIIVYLHRPVEQLKQLINKRGRSYEQNISTDYLLQIQHAYFDYFKMNPFIPVLVFNIENLDFEKEKKHFEMILDHVKRTYQPGVHHFSFTY